MSNGSIVFNVVGLGDKAVAEGPEAAWASADLKILRAAFADPVSQSFQGIAGDFASRARHTGCRRSLPGSPRNQGPGRRPRRVLRRWRHGSQQRATSSVNVSDGLDTQTFPVMRPLPPHSSSRSSRWMSRESRPSEKLRLSARGFHRVLKLARTIADLQGADHVRRPHLAEALSYRSASDRAEAVSRNETFSASH